MHTGRSVASSANDRWEVLEPQHPCLRWMCCQVVRKWALIFFPKNRPSAIPSWTHGESGWWFKHLTGQSMGRCTAHSVGLPTCSVDAPSIPNISTSVFSFYSALEVPVHSHSLELSSILDRRILAIFLSRALQTLSSWARKGCCGRCSFQLNAIGSQSRRLMYHDGEEDPKGTNSIKFLFQGQRQRQFCLD